MKTIDKLSEEGWKPVKPYAGGMIYEKEGEKLLYDPKRDKVIIKYKVHKVNILKTGGRKE